MSDNEDEEFIKEWLAEAEDESDGEEDIIEFSDHGTDSEEKIDDVYEFDEDDNGLLSNFHMIKDQGI